MLINTHSRERRPNGREKAEVDNCNLLLSLLVVICFPMDDVEEEGNENEELAPFLVDPVSLWHILLWVC